MAVPASFLHASTSRKRMEDDGTSYLPPREHVTQGKEDDSAGYLPACEHVIKVGKMIDRASYLPACHHVTIRKEDDRASYLPT